MSTQFVRRTGVDGSTQRWVDQVEQRVSGCDLQSERDGGDVLVSVLLSAVLYRELGFGEFGDLKHGRCAPVVGKKRAPAEAGTEGARP
jgi:hypothetical protein